MSYSDNGLRYIIQYSVSNRAECSGCKEKILHGHLRIGSSIAPSLTNKEYETIRFRHIECFTGKQLTNLKQKAAMVPKFWPPDAKIQHV